MNELKKEIVKRIESEGSISFRDFMESCLYHHKYGYYTSSNEVIGRGGDYITSPIVSRIFGKMIARQILEMWESLGKGTFQILEVGGGQGFLAYDILKALEDSELFDNLEYYMVEKSGEMIKSQRKELKEFGDMVKWFESLGDARISSGCILTNELVDALPVYQVVMEEDGLKEVWVDYREGKFIEELRPARESIKDYFRKLGVDLEKGFRTEVNLDALSWLDQVAKSLEKGFVITIDYGFPSEELYRPYRSQGTLLCYFRQGVYESPYKKIGKQDITSHVNFSALLKYGRDLGLEFTGFTDLAHFMIGVGLEDYMKKIEKEEGFEEYLKKMEVMKHFIMPESMGQVFKVLVQHKGVDDPELKGLEFPPFGGLKIED